MFAVNEHIASLRWEIEATEREKKKKKEWEIHYLEKRTKKPQNFNGWDRHQNGGNRGRKLWTWRQSDRNDSVWTRQENDENQWTEP